MFLLAQVDPLSNPIPFLQTLYEAVKTGNGLVAATALLVSLVALLRIYGPKVHALLPDHVLLDKPFYFLFDTKPGGWVLNLLTAVAIAAAPGLLSGVPFSWDVVKPVLMVSLSGAAIWGALKDLYEWYLERKRVPAVAPVPPLQ
jgi:hypothetical protein